MNTHIDIDKTIDINIHFVIVVVDDKHSVCDSVPIINTIKCINSVTRIFRPG